MSGKRKPKVYIFTDLEGASGLVSARGGGSIGTEGSESYQQYRRFLTQDVNAAILGALEAGAGDIIVNDAHGSTDHNVLIDMLDPRARLERPVPGNWTPGLDKSCDVAFIIGAHAMAGTKNGFLDHTQSSLHFYNWYLNRTKVGEIGQFAALAGHFGVPVALLTGDAAAVREGKRLLKYVEGIAVKEGLSRNYARGLHPDASAALIKRAACRALKTPARYKPWALRGPVTMKVEYTRSDFAEEACAKWKGRASMPDARTIVVKLKNATEMF